jgi:hypothetical protein
MDTWTPLAWARCPQMSSDDRKKWHFTWGDSTRRPVRARSLGPRCLRSRSTWRRASTRFQRPGRVWMRVCSGPPSLSVRWKPRHWSPATTVRWTARTFVKRFAMSALKLWNLEPPREFRGTLGDAKILVAPMSKPNVPDLPLTTRADIERARERVLSNKSLVYYLSIRFNSFWRFLGRPSRLGNSKSSGSPG